MCQDAAGQREFEFPHSRFAHYGISNATARRSIDALIAAGFISREYSGKISRDENRYRFSLAWKLEDTPD